MKKITIIAILIISVFLLSNRQSNSFGGCDQECTKCHSLTTEEALKAITPLIPDAKVEEVRMSPAKGLWEVSIESQMLQSPRGRGIIYINFSKEYVFFGNLVETKTKISKTQERVYEITKVDYSKISLKDSLILGDPKAKIKVIVFDDPECPACQRLHTELKKVVVKRKDIAFYIKLYPLTSIHPNAYKKALTIQCEKSLKLLEDSLNGRTIPDPKCKTSVIDENMKLANELGITGTPYLILPDGGVIGGNSADILIQLIDNSIKSE